MIRVTIHVDGQPYRGEDIDRTYDTPTPGLGNGWQSHHGDAPNRLLIGGGEPHLIEGHRNLASHVDRILRRVQEGHVTAREITIRVDGE